MWTNMRYQRGNLVWDCSVSCLDCSDVLGSPSSIACEFLGFLRHLWLSGIEVPLCMYSCIRSGNLRRQVMAINKKDISQPRREKVRCPVCGKFTINWTPGHKMESSGVCSFACGSILRERIAEKLKR